VKNAALLMLVLLTASYPAMARPYHGNRHATCEMVRAYMAQIGLAQRLQRADAGITSSEKERARRCLAEKADVRELLSRRRHGGSFFRASGRTPAAT